MAAGQKKMAGKLVVSVTQGCSSSFTVEVLATASDFRVQISGRSGFRFSFKALSDTSGSEPGNSPCLVSV